MLNKLRLLILMLAVSGLGSLPSYAQTNYSNGQTLQSNQVISSFEHLLFNKVIPIDCGSTPQASLTQGEYWDERFWNEMAASDYKSEAKDSLSFRNSLVCFSRGCDGGLIDACEGIGEVLDMFGPPPENRAAILQTYNAVFERMCFAGNGKACGSRGEWAFEDGFEMEETLVSWCEETFGDAKCSNDIKRFMYPNPQLGYKFLKKGCEFESAASCYYYAARVHDSSNSITQKDYEAVVFAQRACQIADAEASDDEDEMCDFAERYTALMDGHNRDIRRERAEQKRRRAQQRAEARQRKADMNTFFGALLGGVAMAMEADRRAGLTPNQRAAETERERIYSLSAQENMNQINANLKANKQNNLSNNARDNRFNNTGESSDIGGRELTLTSTCSLPEWQIVSGTFCENNGKRMSLEDENRIRSAEEKRARDAAVAALENKRRNDEIEAARLKSCAATAAKGIYPCGCPQLEGAKVCMR